MTVDEKRKEVNEYCIGVSCQNCVLKHEAWGQCEIIEDATEEMLDRALEFIDVKPELCELEPAADDAELVIKIKSSRKINCLHIEFAEEE